MEIITGHSIEVNNHNLYSRAAGWMADKRFYYQELKQLGVLVGEKKVQGNLSLGEQLRKDVLRNLKSMLNVLMEDLQNSENQFQYLSNHENFIRDISYRETCMAVIDTMNRIREKIKLLKLRILTFLKHSEFRENRYNRYVNLDKKQKLLADTKGKSDYRTFRTKGNFKKDHDEH